MIRRFSLLSVLLASLMPAVARAEPEDASLRARAAFESGAAWTRPEFTGHPWSHLREALAQERLIAALAAEDLKRVLGSDDPKTRAGLERYIPAKATWDGWIAGARWLLVADNDLSDARNRQILQEATVRGREFIRLVEETLGTPYPDGLLKFVDERGVRDALVDLQRAYRRADKIEQKRILDDELSGLSWPDFPWSGD